MRLIALSLCLACCSPIAVLAQQAPPASVPAKEVTSLAALPAGIRAALGNLSDRGGPFAAGCVSPHGEPHSRFSVARVGVDTAEVTVERGGIAHFFERLAFRKVDGRWVAQPPPAKA